MIRMPSTNWMVDIRILATLIQTRKMSRVPLILVSSAYWGGLVDWMKETMLRVNGNISPQDLDLLKIADTPEEVAEHMLDFYSKNPLEPNF